MILEILGSVGIPNTFNTININLNHVSHTVDDKGDYSVVMNNKVTIHTNEKDYQKVTAVTSLWNLFITTKDNDYLQGIYSLLKKLQEAYPNQNP